GFSNNHVRSRFRYLKKMVGCFCAILSSHFSSQVPHRSFAWGATRFQGEPMATQRFAIFASSFVFVCASINCLLAQTTDQLQLPPGGNAPTEQLPDSTAYIASDQGPSTYHLSLADAKTRVLENSVVMDLATTQISAKCY